MNNQLNKALVDINQITNDQCCKICTLIYQGVHNLNISTIPEKSKKRQLSEYFRQSLRELITTQN